MGQTVTKSYGSSYEELDDQKENTIERHEKKSEEEIIRSLSSKQRKLERKNTNLSSFLNLPAPYKIQRISKLRKFDIGLTLEENVKKAVYDFVNHMHGYTLYDNDISSDSLYNSIILDIKSLLDYTLNVNASKYIEHSNSVALFAQASLMKCDFHVGCSANFCFYIVDVSVIRIDQLCYSEICHLVDITLSARKFAKSHLHITKLLHRFSLIECQYKHCPFNSQGTNISNYGGVGGSTQGRDVFSCNTITGANGGRCSPVQVRCKYSPDNKLTQCMSCQLAVTREKIITAYDKINTCVSEQDIEESDTGDER